MDDADIVVERSEREIGFALRSFHNSAASRRRLAMDNGLMCMLCGEEIPEARRQALPGVCTCIGCQEELERSMGR
jgi:phage/conjugal plasmid C-4 type zinc finger TraR family protein